MTQRKSLIQYLFISFAFSLFLTVTMNMATKGEQYSLDPVVRSEIENSSVDDLMQFINRSEDTFVNLSGQGTQQPSLLTQLQTAWDIFINFQKIIFPITGYYDYAGAIDLPAYNRGGALPSIFIAVMLGLWSTANGLALWRFFRSGGAE